MTDNRIDNDKLYTFCNEVNFVDVRKLYEEDEEISEKSPISKLNDDCLVKIFSSLSP